MQALRLNEVLARVVAWHNRHPLARRINPTQVHSIGAVVLPFATDTPGAAASAVAAPASGQAAAARPLSVSELLDMAPAAVAPPVRQALPTAAPAAPAETDAVPEDVFAAAAAAAAPAQAAELADAAALAAADGAADAQTATGADTDADADALAAAMADAAAQPLPDRAPGPPPDAAAAAPTSPSEPATTADVDPFALAEADMAAEAAALAAAAALAPAQAPDTPPDDTTLESAPQTSADSHPDTDSPTSIDSVDLALSLTPPQPAANTPALATPPPEDDVDVDGHALSGSANDTPAATPATTPAAKPTTPASGHNWWQRLLAGLRGGKPAQAALQPMFSRSFVWPLRTGRVARWACRHGQLQPLAPAHWPHRLVEVEAPLRAAARQRGLALDVQLHLLTAAIGVGDRRIRLLIGADGQILGPRAYSRSRVAAAAAAAGVVALAGAAAGWALRPTPATPGAGAIAAAAAASAASVASAAVAGASAAASAHASAPAPAPAPAFASASASAPASDHGMAASSAALEPALSASQTAGQTASQAADQAARATANPLVRAPHGSPASADPAASAAADAAPTLTVWPNLKTAKRAQAPLMASASSAPLGRIRPSLAADERLAARQQGAALRGTPLDADLSAAAVQAAAASEPVSPPVFAVVVRPRRFRQTAADDLKVLKSAVNKLSGPVPAHGELLNKDGAWHAAWWPFDSEADAERARVLLAGRGLKADVVAF